MKLTVTAILFVALATLTGAHDDRKDPEYLRSKVNTARTNHHETRSHEHIEGRCTNSPPNWTANEFGDSCDWYDSVETCDAYGSDFGTDGRTASQACCTCGGGSGGSPAPGPSPSGDAAAWEELHNKRRQKYSALWGHEYQPVAWNGDLAAQAQAWSDHLLAKECGSIPHAPRKCVDEGENNHISQSWPEAGPKNLDKVLNDWTEAEIADTAHPEKAGHASQVIWVGTTKIGCGYSTGTCSDGWKAAVSVCRYFPAGNLNCNGHCIDSVKAKHMPVDNTKSMKSNSVVDQCLKTEVSNYS